MTINSNNFLSATGFQLVLDSTLYPGLSCTIQSATIPALNIGHATRSTPYRDIPYPGDKLVYDALTVSMIIKEDLSNYETVLQWLEDCVKTKDDPLIGENGKTSDIRINLFTNKNILSKTFKFVMAFPSDIGAISLNTTDASDEYLTVDVIFQYAYFELE